MRTVMSLLAIALLVGGAGCSPPGPVPDAAPGRQMHVVSKDGLTVELILPGYSFYRGQELPIKVVAVNSGEYEAVFRADSGAPAYVTLWRRRTLGWEKFNRFPEAVVLLPRTWALPPGQSRSFQMNLWVGPDWPTHDPLKLTAQLNGLPGVAPSAMIDVYATRAEYDRATGAADSN